MDAYYHYKYDHTTAPPQNGESNYVNIADTAWNYDNHNPGSSNVNNDINCNNDYDHVARAVDAATDDIDDAGDDETEEDEEGGDCRTKRYQNKPSVTRSRTCVHPSELYTLSKKKCTDDDLMECAIQYLRENAVLQEYCNDPISCKKRRKCQCLSVFLPTDDTTDDTDLDDESNITIRVAKFMVFFCKKHKDDQQRLVIQWIQQARLGRENKVHKQCLYHFPCLLVTPDLPPMEWLVTDVRRICYGALLCVLGKGRKFYVTCRNAATFNVLPKHKLRGRRSNSATRFEKYIADDLHIFFEEFAAYVQHPTTNSIFHGIDSQRKLYRLFCYERGWDIILKDSKLMIEEMAPRLPDDQRLQICSRNTFQRFWQDNYSHLDFAQPHKNSAYKNKKYSKSSKKSLARA